MNVLRITSMSLLLIFVCSTSTCLKNDQAELSSHGDPNLVRRSRRIGLNEYLVPPPIPQPQPVRSGRVANPSPAEAPGYFSQLMNWLNPFNFGSSPPTHPKSLPQLEPPAPPKPHNPPPFNIHSAPHSGPSHHPPLGSQPVTTLYTPFVGRLLSQQPGPSFTAPTNAHSGPSLGPPPSPPLQFYNVPSATFHDIQHVPPSPDGGRGIYVPANKGKPCNLCNKIPWIPMQSGGFNFEKYPLPPQLSNGYLPPKNQANQDAQHAASQEIRIPDFSHVPIAHKVQYPMFNTALPNLLLYPLPMPPLYEAEPFGRPSQSPPAIDSIGRVELSSLPVTPTAAQKHANPEINNKHYNLRGDDRLQSFGTEINRSRETEIKREHANTKESFDTSIPDIYPPISAPAFNQEYQNNPSSVKPENAGILSQPVQYIQNAPTNYGSPSFQSHNFVHQNGDEYQELFKSNTGQKPDPNYLPADLNPSANFRTSAFYNHDIESLNYQISDDLSPSGTAQKDSHVTTQPPPVSTFSLSEEHNTLIHFEESPLLDLSEKDENQTSTQGPTTTIEYASSENTMKTTTDYNTETDSLYFGDSTSTVRLTESYSSSDIQDINTVFRPPISTTTDFINSNTNQYIETSTISTGYTDQQEVSYVPSQPGFLWPSLLSNATDLKDDSLQNHTPLNHLVQWNNSFSGIKNFGKQDSASLRDAKDTAQRQPSIKRNKQVQVIIPYTSEYTPIPFQQSRGDWSVRTNFEQTQPRKIPPRGELNANDYHQQESRNDIRVINQSQFSFNDSKKSYAQSIGPSLNAAENSKSVTTKANNSIDVRRLQKNIDNWTIQEYSKPTTFSTVLPSSLHPYLSPSKRIPTEYLTTTEPGDHTNEPKESKKSVKTYSLAGFNFNEIEHEGSASNRVEEAQVPIKVLPIESPEATTASSLQSANKSITEEEKPSWEAQSVSISATNKERVYVVTPQPIPEASSKKNVIDQKEETVEENFANDLTVGDVSNSKNNLGKFEAIEKAYQVLPQAVNNLAVATTGKENVPLWGIMEHEEFASLNLDEHNEEAAENDEEAGPVLYSGHSKVSRGKR
ncbi:uncharacterized protein LOC143433211 [Xylocopa sonorina]|uniref:uncharacterized protein LOC143433211 n=1 Tax=Xylocopa sonorina TaxID=1818115 RepID=UPI00403AD025